MTKHKKLLTLFLIGLFAVSMTGCGLLDKIGPKPTPFDNFKGSPRKCEKPVGHQRKNYGESETTRLASGRTQNPPSSMSSARERAMLKPKPKMKRF